jgi:hypothetical protein
MMGTQLNLFVASSDATGSACLLIPDSMFVVNSDLSAALHIRSDAPGVMPCPGFAITSGLPTSGIVPPGGAGGGESGFVGPFSLDLTWLATQIFASRNTANSTCGAFAGNSQGTFSAALGASATGTISATLAEPPGAPPLTVNTSLASLFADTNTLQEATVVNGPAIGSCGPFGS